MYLTKSCCQRDGLGRAVLSSAGLGDDDSIKKEWGGKVKYGSEAEMLMSTAGKLTGAGLITGFMPKGALKALGIDVNPASLALAPFTFGASLLPGISSLLGKVFGGLMAKATHMESCMKWWSDSNIDSMMGLQPIPFDFVDYMKHNFPQFQRQYQVMQAGGQWAATGIDRLLGVGNRRERMLVIFRQMVRDNPDLMTAQCVTMPEGITEVGPTIDPKIVAQAWAQMKEAARQKEFSTLAAQVDKRVSPFKVKETWGEIVSSRNKNLAISKSEGSQLITPGDMIGVKRGAYIMTLKSGQTSSKPVTFVK